MALITIADKITLDSLTASEFNQLLDALKSGILEINTAGFQIAGVTLTPTAVQFNILADDGSKGNAILGRSAGGAVGNIQTIDGDPNNAAPLTFLNMPFWVKKTIAYDDTSPVTIFAVDDGYVAHAVLVNVTETWDDGSKAFEVGYTADADAFITDLGAALETGKYYGIEDDYWGARLYDATDKHQKLYVFSAATNIIATFVGTGNSGSQGECDVWVQISRLN